MGLFETGYVSYSDSKIPIIHIKDFIFLLYIEELNEVCVLEHYIDNNNFNIQISEDQTLSLFDNISPRTDQTYDVGPYFWRNILTQNYIWSI